MKRLLLILILALTGAAHATTWWVRADGGTRYDVTNVPTGQCDGQADAAYPGSGVNQHCAYNEVQYLWDVGTGTSLPVAPAWIISGGDTIVIRGCASGSGACRIGWSAPTGGANIWCSFVGNNTCYNPTIPAGTSGAHTKFIGGYAYDHGGNASGGGTQPHTYKANLTELFGGYDLFYTFNLGSTSYVDVIGIELTVHNAVSSGNPGYPGNCTTGGSPAYPVNCQTGAQPYDDNARNGFLVNATSTNLTFTDVYAYGFSGSGFIGPIGAGISGTRVESSFNAGDAWQFDDGSDTPNGTGSSWNFDYFTGIGNGCYGEYPIVHTAFPARACYDGSSGGPGGDTLSGQDGQLTALTLNHGYFVLNTKDSWIGPHTQVGVQTITNSYSFGNEGAQWKWGQATGGTVTFENNLTVGNCGRLASAIPGAVHTFNLASGLGGAYLSAFCRAGGIEFALVSRSGSTNLFAGNTMIGASDIIVSENCGYYSPGNVFNPETNCNTSSYAFKNNIYLGYTYSGDTPTLYYDDSLGTGNISFTTSYNQQFGVIKTTDVGGSPCGTNNVACGDPLLISEPPQSSTDITDLDVFNPATNYTFYPDTGSPAIGAGTPVSGLTADYYGVTRPSPPAIGAVEPSGTPTASAPAFSPTAPYTGVATTLTMTTSSSGAIICYNTTGATILIEGSASCPSGSTLYTAGISVSATTTFYAVAGGTGWLDSSLTTGIYTITAPPATQVTITGTAAISGGVTIP